MSWLSKLLRGGRSRSPAPPRESEAQIAERLRREREAEQRRLRDERLPVAINEARSLAEDILRRRGIADVDYYNPIIQRAIDRTAATIPDTDTMPANYFGPSLIEAALSEGAQDRRQRFLRDVDEVFVPELGRRYIPPSLAASLVDQVLSGQRREAVSAVERAKARGNLADTGLSASLGRIGELEVAGRDRATSLAESALQRLRDDLEGIGARARTAATSYMPGRSFSIDPFVQQKQAFLAELPTRIEGAVRGALEGQSFFDIGDILTRGGRIQGAQNPRIARFPYNQRREDDNVNTGLGSTL